MKHLLMALVGAGVVLACSSSHGIQERTKFTRLDSLTENYLTLQDSVHQSWNLVLKAESDREKALSRFLELITQSNPRSESLNSLSEQLVQLERIRFTASTLSNTHIVREYDTACESLARELRLMTPTNPPHEFSRTLQSLAATESEVKTARLTYDQRAKRFNQFLELNEVTLREVEKSGQLEARPLFATASDR